MLLGLHLDILHGYLGLYDRNHMHGHVPLVFMLLWMEELFIVIWCRGRRESADRSLLKYHGLLDSNLLHYNRLLGLWRGRGMPLHTLGFHVRLFGLVHGCLLRNHLRNHVWSERDWLRLRLGLLHMAVMAICVLRTALWEQHDLLLLLRHHEVGSDHLLVTGAWLLRRMLFH